MPEEKTKEVIELQVPSTLKRLVEALVFAAKEPLTIKQIKDIYEGEGPQSYLRQLDAEEVEASVNELNAEYEKDEKPYRIIRIAGGFQFATLSGYADWIGRLYKEQARRKLSQSGIESLAIIAYKQPVTKADIESIRGVNCDYVLKTLLEKELVTIVGRAHAPGRPLLYGTTREFLKHFGLNEITDLPRPREIEEILGESQFETERRMLEAQAGAERMKDEEPEFKSRLPHIPKKKSELDKTVEIKSKDSLREIKTLERPAQTTEIVGDSEFETAAPSTASEKTFKVPVVESSPALDKDSSVELPSSHATVESTFRITVPAEDVMASVPENSADKSLENRVAEDVPPLPTGNNESVAIDAAIDEQKENPYENKKPRLEEVLQAQAGSVENVHQAANKSKWQTWKERVQGFIKKIFG
jgi:segregation and condensation protein B